MKSILGRSVMGSSMENAAVNVLKRAVDFDNNHRYTEALICYQEGIQLLIDCMKSIDNNEKKKHFTTKIEDYMERAKLLKKHIEDKKGQSEYHEQIQIENNSIGHSYKSVFGRFLSTEITQVHLEDPYIRSFHQCHNLLRFCELVVKKCPNVKKIDLLTSTDSQDSASQAQNLRALQQELASRLNISFSWNYSSTLHDRLVRLSNGWTIQIGRGLDYFKPPKGQFSLGYYDLDLRPCHETTIHIVYHKTDDLRHQTSNRNS